MHLSKQSSIRLNVMDDRCEGMVFGQANRNSRRLECILPCCDVARSAHHRVIHEVYEEKMCLDSVLTKPPEMSDPVRKLIEGCPPVVDARHAKSRPHRLKCFINARGRNGLSLTGWRSKLAEMGLSLNEDRRISGQPQGIPLRTARGPEARQRRSKICQTKPFKKSCVTILGKFILCEWRKPPDGGKSRRLEQVRSRRDRALNPFQRTTLADWLPAAHKEPIC